MKNNDYEFRLNEKLGIKLPYFSNKDWDDLDNEQQLEVIKLWEYERAKIPDRIKELELEIESLQDKIFELDFSEYCKIHQRIVDLSSAINDLNIWFRTEGELTKK